MNTRARQPRAVERALLRSAYERVREASVALAAPLSAEDCQIQSMPDASPTKWHLAHTTWFFETFVLECFERNFRPFDPSFRVLFNSYYETVGDKHPRPQRGLLTRPSLEHVVRYRRQIDERMLALMSGPVSAQAGSLIALGLQHEQQHQELVLTDIKHALSCNPAYPAYARRWPIAAVAPQPLRWFGFGAGLTDIGYHGASDGTFCFDNETPRHKVWLEPFELASRPVTYGEYLAFIDDGGYERAGLWLSLGWEWVNARRARAPLYWQHIEGRWRTFTLQGMADIDPNTPVCHLNYFEADAYARWAGARLPTEMEWECAARSLTAAQQYANFADRRAFHPLPQSRATGEPVQMYGDVWEWTSSSYGPYPGYRAAAGAVGEYNGKFMCNQYVLRGGSCATPAGHVRASYRNFFAADAQWQFSGVRLARNAT